MNVLKKVNFIVTALDLKSVFMTKDNKVVWLTRNKGGRNGSNVICIDTGINNNVYLIYIDPHCWPPEPTVQIVSVQVYSV